VVVVVVVVVVALVEKRLCLRSCDDRCLEPQCCKVLLGQVCSEWFVNPKNCKSPME